MLGLAKRNCHNLVNLSNILVLGNPEIQGSVVHDQRTVSSHRTLKPKKTFCGGFFETFSCSDFDANFSLVLWYDEVISLVFIVICGFLSHKLPMKEKDFIYFLLK